RRAAGCRVARRRSARTPSVRLPGAPASAEPRRASPARSRAPGREAGRDRSSRSLAPSRARHGDAELLFADVRRELAHELTLVNDEDAVREREDLVELERDEQNRSSGVALRDEAAVDELDRADVETARRLRRDEDARIAGDLPRENDLLLVASRERSVDGLRPAAAHVVLGQQPSRALEDAPRIEPAPARERRLVVVVERDVLGERELEHEAAPLPVLRDVAEPFLEPDVCARGSELLPTDGD